MPITLNKLFTGDRFFGMFSAYVRCTFPNWKVCLCWFNQRKIARERIDIHDWWKLKSLFGMDNIIYIHVHVHYLERFLMCRAAIGLLPEHREEGRGGGMRTAGCKKVHSKGTFPLVAFSSNRTTHTQPPHKQSFFLSPMSTTFAVHRLLGRKLKHIAQNTHTLRFTPFSSVVPFPSSK